MNAKTLTDEDLRLLTTEEVAKLLQISQITVRRHVDAGKLRCVKIGNRRRYRRADVDRFTARLARTAK